RRALLRPALVLLPMCRDCSASRPNVPQNLTETLAPSGPLPWSARRHTRGPAGHPQAPDPKSPQGSAREWHRGDLANDHGNRDADAVDAGAASQDLGLNVIRSKSAHAVV